MTADQVVEVLPHRCNAPRCRREVTTALCPEHLAELPEDLAEWVRRSDDGRAGYMEWSWMVDAVTDWWAAHPERMAR